MIAHLVLMNLNESAPASLVIDQVMALKDQIPGLLDITGGTSVLSGKSTWEIGFIMMFTDAEAVTSYQGHPAHVEVGKAIGAYIREMASCDLLSDSIQPSISDIYNEKIGS